MLAVLHAVLVMIDRRHLAVIVPLSPYTVLLAVAIFALDHLRTVVVINDEWPFFDVVAIDSLHAFDLGPIRRPLADQLRAGRAGRRRFAGSKRSDEDKDGDCGL